MSDAAGDLLSSATVIDLTQSLLADLQDNLPEKVARFRYLADLSATLGEHGTMIFGSIGHIAFNEARSSFVHGNFAATILLCQSLAEQTLAGFLHASAGQIASKIGFGETISRCHAEGYLSEADAEALRRLARLRNPVSHFRTLQDSEHVMRRAVTANDTIEGLLSTDAHFAIATIIHVLAQPPFRVGQ